MRAELCAACHSPAQPMSVMLHLQEEEKRTFFQKEFVKDNSETPQEMIKMYNVDTGGTKVTASFVGVTHLASPNDLGFDDDPECDSGQCYGPAVPGAGGGGGSVSPGFSHLVSVSALDSGQCYI